MPSKAKIDPFESEFRWPTAGDDPFELRANTWGRAEISPYSDTRMVGMMAGYRTAADTLVDVAMRDRFQRDLLVFPILFLYRHALELELKFLVNTYGRFAGVDPNWKTHDLRVLWAEFVKISGEFGANDSDGADDTVASIVAEFSKMDPRSFSNRYPVDTKGNPIPVEKSELDLAVLKDVLDGVFGYFNGCDGYFDHLATAGP